MRGVTTTWRLCRTRRSELSLEIFMTLACPDIKMASQVIRNRGKYTWAAGIIIRDISRGIWNVPYIGEVYLIKASVFKSKPLSYVNGALDPDMSLCKNLRERVSTLVDDDIPVVKLLELLEFDSISTAFSQIVYGFFLYSVFA